MRKVQLVWIAGIAAAVWFAGSSDWARAELRVIDSTAPGVARNDVLPDDAAFDVPAGKKIKLLKKPGDTTHEIVGPYKGVLDNYKPGCGWWDWANGKCAQGKDAEGGTRSVSPVMGATRGLTIPKN